VNVQRGAVPEAAEFSPGLKVTTNGGREGVVVRVVRRCATLGADIRFPGGEYTSFFPLHAIRPGWPSARGRWLP
jgi:hypothetical protein